MGRPTEAFIGASLSGKDSRGGVGGRGESSSRVVALAEDAMAARQRWRSRQQGIGRETTKNACEY